MKRTQVIKIPIANSFFVKHMHSYTYLFIAMPHAESYNSLYTASTKYSLKIY